MTTAKQNGTKVITGKVRGSYVNVFRPRLNDLSGEHEYSMTVLVPKKDKATIAALRDARDTAIAKKWGDKPPKGLRDPLRDGDSPDEEKSSDPAYAGHYFFNTKSKDAPGIIDTDRMELTNAGDFVSGDYCRVSLNAYAYDQKGNKGSAFGLNNIQVLGRGEPLSARARAEDEFDDVDEADVSL